MKLRSSILAIAVVVATATAATAAGTPPDRRTGAQAPTTTSATMGDPVALGNQIRAAAKGQKHDAARFQRLMALVRDPQRSAAAVQQWASRGGGAGMGQPMQQPAQPQRSGVTSQAPGTMSQQGTTSPYGTTPDQAATTSTPTQQGALANPPAATDGTTTTTSGGGGGGGAAQGTMAAPRITSVASIIGDDPQAVRTFVQALGTNQRRIADLQASLRSHAAHGLAPGTVDVGTVVGVEVVPGTGGLEIYTVP